MAVSKLSAIASGGAFVVATDMAVTVRSGTTDVLTTLATTSLSDIASFNLSTSGTASAASFIPTSSTLPANGLFLPAANTPGLSANSLEVLRLISVANATNGLSITNAINGGAVTLGVVGTGNVNLTLSAAGAGGIVTANNFQAAGGTFTNTLTGTSTSANALAIGQGGTTNPALQVDTSTASSITGVAVKSAVSGGGVTLTALGSTNENITLASKGASSIANISSPNEVDILVNGIQKLRYTTAQAIFTVAAANGAASPRYSFTGAADAALTASVNAVSTLFDLSQTRTHAAGALTLQQDSKIKGSTHAFASASTITDCAVFSIENLGQAGSNATITNAHGLLIQAIAVAGTVTNAYGINISAPTGAGTLNQAALFTGDTAITSGNLIVNTAGKGIQLKSGSNARIGTGTLSGGTLAVANTSVTANTLVFLTDTTSGALTNVGSLTVVASAGVGFTVSSTNVLDTSTFNWMLVEKN